jgi:Flp pilus assembly protein TadG
MNAMARVAEFFFSLGSQARQQIGRIRTGIQRSNERGSALVELAVCLPILLVIVTGITSFGFALNNYMMLTNAVEVGGRLLAISRGNTTDPCSDVATAITAAAPLLNSANINYTFNINGTSYSNLTYPTTTKCTGGAALLLQGKQMQITVTYPCSLSVYGKNFVPGCTLTAQVSELEQ